MKQDSGKPPIVVAGAGVVGVCTAWNLLRRGATVALLDPEPPGSGCSAGNAGVIAAESVAPLASPAMLTKLPGMLLRRDAPLRVTPGHLLRALPWFLRYLWSARPAQQRRSAAALASLLLDATAAWQRTVTSAGLTDLLRSQGWVFAYDGAARFLADSADRDLQSRYGIAWRLLEAGEREQRLAALGPAVSHAVFYPDSAWVLDPQDLVAGLARSFADAGGQLLRGRLQRLAGNRGAELRLATSAGDLAASGLVICCGADAGHWPLTLDGLRVPLQGERGYHLQYDSPCPGLELPVMFSGSKIVASPLREGLRLAGTAEFCHPDRAPDYARATAFPAVLRDQLLGIPETQPRAWMGRRPTLPDSLPVISRSPRHPGVFYHFGHQHLGLTLAAVSAERMAGLILDEGSSDANLTAFSVSRFSQG